MLRSLGKVLFGYDVFISYPYSGGRQYAEALEKRLTDLDFSCFFDSEELPYGQALKPSLERAIRRSKAFVLVGTEHALTAPYVDLELRTAVALRRAIIPIDVQRIRTSAHWPDIADIPWIEEPSPDAHEPSPAVLDGIRHYFQFTRRNVVARGAVGVAALVFLCIAIVAIWQWRDAVAQGNRALARLLTAQSVLSRTASPDSLFVSALLAAESVTRLSTPDGEEALRQAVGQLPEPPLRVISLPKIQEAYLSPAGDAIAVRGEDGRLVVTNAADGKQIIAFDAGARSFASFSASGDYLVAEVDDAHAEVWSVRTRRKVATFPIPEGSAIEKSHFSLDGSALALVISHPGTSRNSVRVVRLADGRIFDSTDEKSATAAALSEDAALLTTLWTSTFQTVIRVNQLDTGKEIVRKAINGRVRSIALHPSGTAFAMTAPLSHIGGGVSGADVVHLYSVTTFIPPPFHDIEEDNQLDHDAPVTTIASSPNGWFLASMTGRRNIHVWGASGNAVGQIHADEDVVHLALSNSGAIVAVSGDKGYVHVYDVSKGRRLVSVQGDFEAVSGLALDQSGKVLTVVDRERGVGVYAIKEGTHLFEQKEVRAQSLTFGPDERVLLPLDVKKAKFGVSRLGSQDAVVELDPNDPKLHAAFHADGKHLVSLTPYIVCGGNCDDVVKGDGAMRVWDIATGRLVERRALEPVATLALSKSGRLLAVVHDAHTIEVGDTIARTSTRIDAVENVRDLVFGDDAHLAVRTKSGVQIYDVTSSRVVASMPLDEDDHVSQITPDGRFAFTFSMKRLSGRIDVWDVSAAKKISAGDLSEIAPLPDGVRAVARIHGAPAAVLIDLRTGGTIAQYAHGATVAGIAVSSDGRYVATAGDDGYARVWDASRADEIVRLPHADAVSEVAFSVGGRYLATSTRGEDLKIWAWRPDDTLAEAARRVSRNLTPEEWRRYLPDQAYRATFPSLKAPKEKGASESR